MRARPVAAIVAAVAVLGALGYARSQSRPRAAEAGEKDRLVVTTTVKRQDLLITVSETGVVAAKDSTPVIPEISGRIQFICGNGIVVGRGDTVVRLDPKPFEEALTNLQVRYEEALRRMVQTEMVGEEQMKGLRLRLQRSEDQVTAFERQQEVTLQQAADSLEFNSKELERLREDAEVTRRLAAKGLVAETEVERQDAAVKSAEFSLTREKVNYELAKSQAAADLARRRQSVSYTTRDMGRARGFSQRGMRMGGNQVENLTVQLARAEEDLAKTTLTAPTDGLVMLAAQTGVQGDTRPLRTGDYAPQGREVASIVSLERMEVKLELGQAEITQVWMGQEAEVTIDALPGNVLKGKITSIGQTARRPPLQGWSSGLSSSATFPVTIDLPPIGKALIRPGMRAGVRVVSRKVANALTVPTGCIFEHEGHPVVFAEREGTFVATRVTLGDSNREYTAITKGLKEGDRIALNDLGAPLSAGASEQGKSK